MFENIPQELKYDGLWCCWKKTENGKVPYDAVRGTLAKTNDKTTFYSYKTILNHSSKYIKYDGEKQLGGIGLGIFNGFSAIDIDHCIDSFGNISDMAKEIIDYCQSYTEKSPSGTGIRIIFKTDFTDFDKKIYYTNNSKIGLEVYIEGFTNKFVTMTGNVILSCDIAKVDIKYILDKYMAKAPSKVSKAQPVETKVDIKDFLERDSKLNDLWYGQAPGDHSNESELDLALCSKLAFYLGKNADAMNNAFVSSPYFESKDTKHKDKWLVREDYRENTIQKAIDSCTAVYDPNNKNTYSLDDTGNAHRFIDMFGNILHYNIDNKMWMLWADSNWQYDVFNNVKNYAEILIEDMKMEAFNVTDLNRQMQMLRNINRLSNSAGKEAMLREAQHLAGVGVNNDMFDRNDFLLNCKNGVVDLKSGILIPHNKNLLLNKMVDANYDKDATCDRFLQFMNEVFEGKQEIIEYLQKAFGYSLTGSCREQIMFILTGDGANGKSVLLQIINEIIGDYAAVSNPELLLDKKTQSNNLSEVARLKGIRFDVVNELKMGDKLNESGVKDITSGNNKIVARFLYGNEFEFYFKAKIWLATNYDPKIVGVDNGIWRRIVKIPCNRIFKENEQDKDLINKLRLEKDGILNWLIQGCQKWQKEGLQLPKSLQEEKDAYRKDSDIIQLWMEECCDVNDKAYDSTTNLFDSFKDYCIKNNEFIMSNTLFGRNMGKKFNKTRMSGSYVYWGIKVRSKI